MKTNYIITGGLGFIGKNLSNDLSSLNQSPIVLDLLTGCDLCKTEIILSNCDTLIHLAALTNVRSSILNPTETFTQNCASTLNCLNYAKEHNVHFIFTSSMGAPASLSPYSASKLACEALCTAYRESLGVKTTILRLSNVYGSHSLHKTSVIAKFIKNCIDKQPLTIFGDGSQTRDFIHVDDVTRSIINCPDVSLINIASGTIISILHLAQRIQGLSTKLLSFTPEIHFTDAIKGEINSVDSSTDIEPTVDLNDGLKNTFKWFIGNYNAKQLG